MPRMNLPRRSFGIELETASGHVRNYEPFSQERDGSISGYEYASPILRGRAGLRVLRGFMRRSVDIRVDRRCGYHLHIDMRDLPDHQIYTIGAAYLATERKWFERVSPSRQNNSYAMRFCNNGRIFMDLVRADRNNTPFTSFCYTYDRYQWINFQAYNVHGTIENRLHHGTFNFRKVAKWAVLNLHFVRLVRGEDLLSKNFVDLPAICGRLFDTAQNRVDMTFPEWAPCWEPPYTTPVPRSTDGDNYEDEYDDDEYDDDDVICDVAWDVCGEYH